MQLTKPAPTPNSYWVEPGLFLAGNHPGAKYAVRASQTLRSLLEAGVRVFVDLTEKQEYYAYERLLEREAATLRCVVAYYQVPVPDMTAPSLEQMNEILGIIDTALLAERPLFLHCLHGRGRTGTVVGCYLVRRGMTAAVALAEVMNLRQGLLEGEALSPHHPAQIETVQNWS